MKMFITELEEPAAANSCGGLGLTEYGAVLSDMDDIWTSLEWGPDKFELLDLSLGEQALGDSELGDFLDWSLDKLESKKLVHHDCMWAGTCSDKYHPENEPENVSSSCPAVTPAIARVQQTPVAPVTVQSAPPGRSLLLTASRAQQQPSSVNRPPRSPRKPSPPPQSPRRPDTPQSLDEEEPPQFKHHLDLAACAPARTPTGLIIRDYEFQEGEEDVEEDCKDDSDEDDEDFEEEEEEEDEEEAELRYKHQIYDDRMYRENTIASDHSYTLCKTSKQNHMENLGVETPSDSEEEEIDVETLGEKLTPGNRGAVALPTNPSAMDRHQLQRTVASAMGRPRPARPPRPHKRLRAPSPPPPRRKRIKLAKSPSTTRMTPPKRRSPSSPNSDSEADNIEKRSLHNDMERQRRIGLKNLFDELKREVPSIREKERAPKVVVLREAAALCARLQREEREREQLRARQGRLLARVRHLRLDLAARRPAA